MRIHLIPGIGGTADMFRDYRFPFPVQTLEFLPPPAKDCDFTAYARFFAERHGIAAGDALVGMSLGGLMACEVAKQMLIRKLVLVSSGTRAEHINGLLRRMSLLSPHVPFALLQRLTVPVGLFGSVRRRTLAMFKASDAAFLRWACWNAPRWEGLKEHPDLIQIHGGWDPVFPPRLQAGRLHHLLPRAGHITLMRQVPEINALLVELLAPLTASGK